MQDLQKQEIAATEPVVDANATIQENKETNSTNTNEELAKQNQLDAEERLPGVIKTAEEGEEEEKEEEEWTFKTTARSLEELPIDSIRPFNLIPDFENPTEADNPIIVRTPDGNHCIEGLSLVKLAESEGKTSILCEIDQLEIHDETELCLRKAGIRTLTRGGSARYAEMVRNTIVLVKHLLSSDDDLHIYGHGQRRYKEGFVNNQEEDVRHLLSIRLGKDRDTINSYLSHGEYLSDETIKIFIDRKAPKEFFVKVQTKKRIQLKNLKGKKLTAGRTITAISKFMLEEFKEYLKEKDTERAGQTRAQGSPKPEPKSGNQSTAPTKDPTLIDDTDDGDDLESKEPVTTEKIFSTYDGVSKRMAEDLTKGISIPEMETRLKEELKIITQLLNMISHLSSKEE